MFAGRERIEAVGALVTAFDRANADRTPQFVLIEAETGLGKTKMIQELYAQLAAGRQGAVPYWPARIDTKTTGDVLRDRKRVTPLAPFTIVGGAPMTYLWWGMVCVESDEGVTMPTLAESARQFEFHAAHLGSARGAHVDTALELTKDVLSVVGLASPIQLAATAVDVAKTSAGWIQRWRSRSKSRRALASDRQVDMGDAEGDERASRLAAAVRAAATSGLPAVIVIDDAQYADASLISFLRQLSQIDEGAVLVVKLAWRSAVKERHDGTSGTVAGLIDGLRATTADRFQTIRLDKLEDEAVDALLLQFAPETTGEQAREFRKLVDGNPLLLRLYLDLDVVQRDISADGRLDTDFSHAAGLDALVRDVWRTLWRGLPARARLALSLAAMQGPTFLSDLVLAVAREIQAFGDVEAGLIDASDTYGWVDAPQGAASFTERPRYVVAREALDGQLTAQQQAIARRAIVARTAEIEQSREWEAMSLSMRRLVLRVHVETVLSDPDAGDQETAARAASELTELAAQIGDDLTRINSARRSGHTCGGRGAGRSDPDDPRTIAARVRGA